MVTKSGFPNSAIKQEIDFRNNHKADFILTLKDFKENQYTEKIIDGIPLARIKKNKDEYIKKANKLWREYCIKYEKEISPNEYLEYIGKHLEDKIELLRDSDDEEIVQRLSDIIKNVSSKISVFDSNITVTLSHGDLQPGNIWVENITDKIYIIDWESVLIRSLWYDEVLLYEGLRMPNGLKKLFDLENSIRKYVLILEELLYRLDDVCCLPTDIRRKSLEGIANDFDVSNIK